MGTVLAALVVGDVMMSSLLEVVILVTELPQNISNGPMQALFVLWVVVNVGSRLVHGTGRIVNPFLLKPFLKSSRELLHDVIIPTQM